MTLRQSLQSFVGFFLPQFLPFWRFNRWCEQPYKPEQDDAGRPKFPTIVLNEAVKKYIRVQGADGWSDKAFADFNEIVQSQSCAAILFNFALPGKNHVLDGKTLDPNRIVGQFTIQSKHKGSLTLRHLSIRKLELVLPERPLDIVLDTCDIAELTVTFGSPNAKAAALTICNTRIGKFAIGGQTVARLEMSGGCVLDIECPAAYAENPFKGSVAFSPDVYFPRTTKHYLLRNGQSYMNMAAHLESLNNMRMAHVFHAALLGVERRTDPWPNKILSFFYSVFSDYGLSAFRPFAWVIALLVISAFISWSFHGAVLALGDEYYKNGWRAELIGPGIGRCLRAGTLAIQQTINPLGLFSMRALVIPSTWWMGFVGTIHSLLSTINITLFIFAIRRRFKL